MAGTSWPTLVAGQKARASDVESKFDWLEGSLVPMNSGTSTDGVYDLGTTTAAWNNLWCNRVYVAQGSLSAPTLSFEAQQTTGFYQDSLGRINWSIIGTLAGELGLSNGSGYLILNVTTSASDPFFTFSVDKDTGVGRGGANSLFLFAGGLSAQLNTTSFLPGTNTSDLGNASGVHWSTIYHKLLTDVGCLAWLDEGVEMQSGTITSDLKAIGKLIKHPTKLTVYGKPMLDYKSFPKISYKKAIKKLKDKDGNIIEEELPRDENDEPYVIDEKTGKKRIVSDGVEMTSMFSVMLGAFREILGRLEMLEKKT